jgi:hypothetical protein
VISPAVLADFTRYIGRDLPLIRTALAEIDKRAGGAFTSLDRQRRETLMASGSAAALWRRSDGWSETIASCAPLAA